MFVCHVRCKGAVSGTPSERGARDAAALTAHKDTKKLSFLLGEQRARLVPAKLENTQNSHCLSGTKETTRLVLTDAMFHSEHDCLFP